MTHLVVIYEVSCIAFLIEKHVVAMKVTVYKGVPFLKFSIQMRIVILEQLQKALVRSLGVRNRDGPGQRRSVVALVGQGSIDFAVDP